MDHIMWKKVIFVVLLWGIVAASVLFAYFLSSQSGASTFRLSNTISTKIADILYKTPDTQQILKVNTVIRKLAHVTIYFVLAILCYIAFYYTMVNFTGRTAGVLVNVMITMALSAFAFYDEWHKQFIPGRHNTISEAFLNNLGVVIGLIVVNVVQRIIK